MKTKRILSLVFAAALILALFSGCGGTQNTPATAAPNGGTAAPGGSTAAPGGTPATQAPDDGGVFYHYAKGNNPNVTADGMPTAAYNYELPLTNSDEILTMWTTCWIPFVLDDAGILNLPSPRKTSG